MRPSPFLSLRREDCRNYRGRDDMDLVIKETEVEKKSC